MESATEAKAAVENAQRGLRATGVHHTARFFELRDNRWIPCIQYVSEAKVLTPPTPRAGFNLTFFFIRFFYRLPQDPQEATEAVQAWIWSPPSQGSREPSP
jgi:hypothetical protein